MLSRVMTFVAALALFASIVSAGDVTYTSNVFTNANCSGTPFNTYSYKGMNVCLFVYLFGILCIGFAYNLPYHVFCWLVWSLNALSSSFHFCVDSNHVLSRFPFTFSVHFSSPFLQYRKGSIYTMLPYMFLFHTILTTYTRVYAHPKKFFIFLNPFAFWNTHIYT